MANKGVVYGSTESTVHAKSVVEIFFVRGTGVAPTKPAGRVAATVMVIVCVRSAPVGVTEEDAIVKVCVPESYVTQLGSVL